MTVLLEVNDLSISFLQYIQGFRQSKLSVVHGLNVTVNAGEIVALVGSSGAGKSLLAHAILGILPDNAEISGKIRYEGEELTSARQAALRGREIALVPQSVNYLDPLMRVGAQVRTKRGDTKDAVKQQRNVFERYGLSPKVEQMYPFELSGGMARRVLVSTAAVSGARLVIADEPTPGLDAAIVREALGFFKELADQGCGVLFITHDVEAALQIAHKVAIIYAGTTVETARPEDFCGSGEWLRHPYSKALWRALPQNGFVSFPGSQPHPNELPPGCRFAPRCQMATAECMHSLPDMRELNGGLVRCIHAT
ncbi:MULTISPECIES: ABC transporter ATP-binding protein [unclassified Paenibacillus]|uniref:ABC transporter ATP-binding protein n=1 Tax=unclassified Paenibacillus TaxID=185978 RepID=UPI001AE5BD21|nr:MULTISPECIES: ABC transporter ATP-binding protein [unclassified Paenibacillus]MBP1155895.1 peptide/nickel transport system ATP-binding protein [Paenibacillus sp. PvP091]MBP1168719.1 peptide/nickel transport system ATP-binding protein [Paenibacillus sp. PvR098]MBP2439747.1 peptide/nickel transport system ATP-binding protein [Paenibacillus sp. PvP052]